jgi:hypothetical protein
MGVRWPASKDRPSVLPSNRRTLRVTYLALLLATIALGLASRRFASALLVFIAAYAGDTLWAMAAYWAIALIAPKHPIGLRALAALAIAFTVELSQLFHLGWLDAIRMTRPGGWVLGFGFLWSDLVCYVVGVGLAVALDRALGEPSSAR